MALNASTKPNQEKLGDFLHQQLVEVGIYLNRAKTEMLADDNFSAANIPKHFDVINSRINNIKAMGFTDDQIVEAHFNTWGSPNATVAEDQTDYAAFKAATVDLVSTIKANKDAFQFTYDANENVKYSIPLTTGQKNALTAKIDAVLALLST